MAKLVSDPELQAMQEIAEALGGLDEAARRRVLAWVNGRHGEAAPACQPPTGGEVPQRRAAVPDVRGA